MTDTSAVEKLAKAMRQHVIDQSGQKDATTWEDALDYVRRSWLNQAYPAHAAAVGLGWVGPEEAGRLREEADRCRSNAEAMHAEWSRAESELAVLEDQRDEVLALCDEHEATEADDCIVPLIRRALLAREGTARPPESNGDGLTGAQGATSRTDGSEASGALQGETAEDDPGLARYMEARPWLEPLIGMAETTRAIRRGEQILGSRDRIDDVAGGQT